MKKFILLNRIMIVFLSTIILIACNSSKSKFSRINSAYDLFQKSQIDHHSDGIIKDNSNLVIVIGENHASSENQKNLASILESLKQEGLLDMVLIEGSYGKVEYDDFVTDFKAESKKNNLDVSAYWKQQLDWGKISGYEYFALTNQGVDVFGVEDMAAKDIYALTSNSIADQLKTEKSSYNRAIRLFDGYISQVKKHVNEKELEILTNELNDYKAAIDVYDSFSKEYAKAYAPIEKEYSNLAALYPAYYEQYNIIKEPLEELTDQYSKLDSVKYNNYETAYNKIRIHHSNVQSQKNSLSYESYEMQMKGIEQDIYNLNNTYNECSHFAENQNKFFDSYETEYKKFTEIRKKMDILDQIIEKKYKVLTPYSDKKNEKEDFIEDQHFILANQIKQHCIDFKIGVDSLMDFFKNDNAIVKKESENDNVVKLSERDKAMVENTRAELEKVTDKIVVLIVGYAHVDGISQKLKSENISFVCGGLKNRDKEIEPWENYSWEKRRSTGNFIFSDRNGMKEITKLLNKRWEVDQYNQLEYFKRIEKSIISGSVGSGKPFCDLPNKDILLYITNSGFERNANYGKYVIDYGPVPGKDNKVFLAIDRTMAKNETKTESNANCTLAYFEKTENGAYQIFMKGRNHSVAELKQYASKNPREKIVLFGGPDEINEGGISVSELYKELKQNLGGFSPPRPPKAKSKPSEIADEGSDNIIRTNNPERANKNISKLSKLKKEYVGKFVVIEEKDINSISKKLYTPRRGDYSKTVVFLVKSTKEYRQAITNAAENKLLKNKQIVLITCGDAFSETAELRESILNAGGLMVWVPDRQIPEAVGRKLLKRLLEFNNDPLNQDVLIEPIMNHVIEKWKVDEPKGEWSIFQTSGSHVQIINTKKSDDYFLLQAA